MTGPALNVEFFLRPSIIFMTVMVGLAIAEVYFMRKGHRRHW